MIDSTIIDALPIELQTEVKMSLARLAATQVFKLQSEELIRRLAHGAFDDSDESLVREIRDTRRELAALQSLQTIGERYKKELDNENS